MTPLDTALDQSISKLQEQIRAFVRDEVLPADQAVRRRAAARGSK